MLFFRNYGYVDAVRIYKNPKIQSAPASAVSAAAAAAFFSVLTGISFDHSIYWTGECWGSLEGFVSCQFTDLVK